MTTAAKVRNRAKSAGKVRAKASGNGKPAKRSVGRPKKRAAMDEPGAVLINIPPIKQTEIELTMVGDRPLLVCNKMNVVQELDDIYNSPGGKGSRVPKPKSTPDEMYARAFYVMPDSKYPPPDPRGSYGIPVSGIKKCVDKAIRTTGITDNTTIGEIAKAFSIMADQAGLCQLQFKRLERDIRPVNIGSGVKTVPQLRHRPMFHDWSVKVRIRFNPMKLSPEAIANLFNHAGQYIGWGEMRAEKKQGECGGFFVKV